MEDQFMRWIARGEWNDELLDRAYVVGMDVEDVDRGR